MAGKDNLKSLADLTTEQQREIASMGGKASAEAKREKKLIKDTILEMLDMPMKKGELTTELQTFTQAKSKNSNLTVQQAMVAAMIKRALKGDPKAFNAIRDTAGEKPTDKVEHTGSIPVVIKDDISE